VEKLILTTWQWIIPADAFNGGFTND